MFMQIFGLRITSCRLTKKIFLIYLTTNGVLVISDGVQARMGSLTATQERFMRWRTIDGEVVDPLGAHQDLETLIRGLFNKETF